MSSCGVSRTTLYMFISSTLRSFAMARFGCNAQRSAPPPIKGSQYVCLASFLGSSGRIVGSSCRFPPAHFTMGASASVVFGSPRCITLQRYKTEKGLTKYQVPSSRQALTSVLCFVLCTLNLVLTFVPIILSQSVSLFS